MNWINAVLLGILEGLTEFLPVSSTGHLILLGGWLGYHDDTAKTLEVTIQLGAVLAVVIYFRKKLGALLRGVLRGEPDSLRLALALGIAFLPVAVVGTLLHGTIKEHLFGAMPVGLALVVGGVVMIGVEAALRRRAHRHEIREAPSEEATRFALPVTPVRALGIGLAQCFALWPGASRSMTTLVGGQLAGLSTAAAAEFSFLLAIPTLGAATLLDLAKNGRALFDAPGGVLALVLGLGASFVVALLVIAAFLRYLKRFGLVPFGFYRILLGAVVLWAATR